MLNRKIEPNITIPKDIKVKIEDKLVSKTGVNIYKLKFEQFDVIRLSFVFDAGVKYQTKPFLANTTVSMLSEGTKTRKNKKIAELLDFYGIYFDTSIDRDYSVVTICCLSKFFDEAIDICSDILLNPVFPKKELKILLNKRKQSLLVERQKIDYIARESFVASIYGNDHHYGSSFNEKEYDNITREDILDFYNKNYLKNNLFVVVSGNITPYHTDKIISLTDSFKCGPFRKIDVSEVKNPKGDGFLEKKDSLQSAIRIGRVLFNKNHQDFIKMQVLSTILGGYFSARLIKNLREDKGYTYSIFSAMINMEDSGYFVIASEVTSKFTQNAINEIFKEINILQKDLVDSEELDMVKNVIIGEIIRILDGPFGIADITIENIQNNKSNLYISEMIEQINNTTPEDIKSMANKYLNKEQLTTVIVGNK